MNDTQLYLAIGIPSFLVVLAWITSMVQTSRLADQNAKLGEKLDRLAEQQHKDSLNLLGYMVPLHERLASVEAKQGAK
jgi:hypothetical protein